ncbi:hypothetical protein DY926_11725 [Komagataeibacter melaceti]|uniref:Uncharacterized protein n=1 Tax=Komagataeibacter melaceti TaxID=2766577 RepID=A0A371YYN0_9PROT|nr:hypothetical protein [Komagataeibacter melaceti]RFD19344.1 hypothetical protein DY926_11725 [Komagataeibacter melaceti]
MKARLLPADRPASRPAPAAPRGGDEATAGFPLPAAIETLHRNGAITAHHVAAARFWATDYRIGVMGQEDPQLERTSCGLSRRALNGRLGSINRYRYIHDIIGYRYERVLIAALINNRPMRELARSTRHDPAHMDSVMALLLDMLTRHYDAMPGHLWQG